MATKLLIRHGERVVSGCDEQCGHFCRHVFIDLELEHQVAPLDKNTVRSRASSAAYSSAAWMPSADSVG